MDPIGQYEMAVEGDWWDASLIFERPHTLTARWVSVTWKGSGELLPALQVHWFCHTMWDLENEMYAWADVFDEIAQRRIVKSYRLKLSKNSVQKRK